jgi:hypothetical protein
MPTKEYRRMWCKTCNEYTLHNLPWITAKNNDHDCRECGTVYTNVLLSEIPEDKIKEQRERYKLSKKAQFSKMFSDEYLFPNNFTSSYPDVHVIESDAGQKFIDEAAERLRIEQEKRRRIELDHMRAEAKRYKALGRNDICLCGSNKKYKTCCQSKYSKVSF